MSLAYRDVTMPAAVVPYPNGQLPASVLEIRTAFNGGPDLVLCQTAMRAFEALAGACAEATGIRLRITSRADSYRPLAVQEALFRTRYTTAGPTTADRVGVPWKGQRWYRKPGVAQAAIPGTSNHGRAIAVDLSNYGLAWGWLTAHAIAYGLSWELDSEPWHMRVWCGDQLTPAVLKWEETMAAQRIYGRVSAGPKEGSLFVSNGPQLSWFATERACQAAMQRDGRVYGQWDATPTTADLDEGECGTPMTPYTGPTTPITGRVNLAGQVTITPAE